jgi:hypothetical protein
MEHFVRSLKSEWVLTKEYSSFKETQTTITQYIIGYYSRIRLISIMMACYQTKQRQSTTLSLIPWPLLLDLYTPSLSMEGGYTEHVI